MSTVESPISRRTRPVRAKVVGLLMVLAGLLAVVVVAAPSASATTDRVVNDYVSFANNAGGCLDDSSQFGLRVYGCNGSNYQHWVLYQTGDGHVFIRNAFTSWCLDDSAQYGIRTLPCNFSVYEKWFLNVTNPGPPQEWFQNMSTGGCADHVQVSSNNRYITTSPCRGLQTQYWHESNLLPPNRPTITIGNYRTAFCLQDNSVDRPIVNTCSGGTNQQWVTTKRQGSDFYELRNQATGRCLDDSEYNLRMFACNGLSYQSWEFWTADRIYCIQCDPQEYYYNHMFALWNGQTGRVLSLNPTGSPSNIRTVDLSLDNSNYPTEDSIWY